MPDLANAKNRIEIHIIFQELGMFLGVKPAFFMSATGVDTFLGMTLKSHKTCNFDSNLVL